MSLSRKWSLQLVGLFLPSPWLGQLPEGPSHPAPLPSQRVNICLLGSAKYLLLDSHRPRRPQRSLRFLLNALSRGRVLVASPATVPGLGWLAGYHPGESFIPWLTAAGGLQPHRTCVHCQAAGSAAPLPSGVSPRWDVRPRGPRRPGQARSNRLRSGPTRLSAADYGQPALPSEPARADPDPRDPRPGTCKTGSRPERSRTRTDRGAGSAGRFRRLATKPPRLFRRRSPGRWAPGCEKGRGTGRGPQGGRALPALGLRVSDLSGGGPFGRVYPEPPSRSYGGGPPGRGADRAARAAAECVGAATGGCGLGPGRLRGLGAATAAGFPPCAAAAAGAGPRGVGGQD